MEIPDWVGTIFILGLIVLAGYGCILGGGYAMSWVGSLSQAGQKYDVTVTVQAVERSTRFGDHTNVWVRTYGGGDEGTGIVYKLIGFHDFVIGKDYRIVFVDEQYLVFYVIFYFEIRGKVQLIEQVS